MYDHPLKLLINANNVFLIGYVIEILYAPLPLIQV